MTIFKHLSLRMRLTLLMAAMLTMMLAVLTISSIDRAVDYLVPENYVVQVCEPLYYNVEQTTQLQLNTVEVRSIVKDSAIADVIPLGEEEVGLSWAAVAAESSDPLAVQVVPVEKITLTVGAKKAFASSSTIMMLLTILAGIVLTWLVAGQALQPVQDLADAIDTIDAHDLSARIKESPTHDEIHRLTESFNHMLDKLQAAFVQQRTFSANAAHELKTPLAAIQANLDILAMDDEPTEEDYQATIDVIDRQTTRMIKLVTDLLALHEQEKNNLQETIETEALLAQLLEEQASAIVAKQLTVTVNNDLPILYGDRTLLTSALGNLLDNAIKYQHFAGHIAITLAQKDGQAHLTVWDDGEGIAVEQLEHIFEPFYRCDLSRSNKIAGSGLGLPLVRTIAKRHGGTVSVSCSSEAGTAFTIILPEGAF